LGWRRRLPTTVSRSRLRFDFFRILILLQTFVEGIVEARGATTDLAELLSSLDDTEDLSSSLDKGRVVTQLAHQGLSSSLRHSLPRTESLESLRSTASDVPDDLQELIRSVSDHISEIELDVPFDEEDYIDTHAQVTFDAIQFQFDPTDAGQFEEEMGDPFEDEMEDVPCFDDEEDYAPFAEHEFEATDVLDVYDDESGGSTTGPLSSDSPTQTSDGGDSTSSSFEGHVSTAAMALRAMLDGPAPGEAEPRFMERADSGEGSAEPRFRDSVQEYLAMERPTVSLPRLLRDKYRLSDALASRSGTR
jgi:hypothetical protein